MLFDDSTLRGFNKVDDVLNLRRQRNGFLDELERISTRVAALVDDAIGLVYVLNQFIGETTTTQPNQVDTRIADGLFSSDDIRWNVLRGSAPSYCQRFLR